MNGKLKNILLSTGVTLALVSAAHASYAGQNVRILEEIVLSDETMEAAPEVVVVTAKPAPVKLRAVARIAAHKRAERNIFGVAPVSDESLSKERGTFNPEQLGVAIFDANANNNTSDNSVTGYNSISSDAFGNSKGVVSLIQNTGNNVIIQNATVVNLTISQ